ncbi:MAG: transcription termination/antitermination protein NusA [Candidatus Buchananbacteria bacterium CG10_big_fil_rev_8_21_14_0_10_42_9]|uniref:Transcription termination/antitermination protein NusA n=1 Tax=Candidatus Buchananbacteria bacterium CG10_big_fil_rev_8_21_14_0_10_42_9 TaxID=1974526 RepID=A0A2H0W1K8_9BACT|nr:MAG: transcription termination/antitermination protein NusA [Candidatus Buchananbacteria bacterium CG10_big_fil_rev_8_21_14_0_10_42_9]
MAESQIAQAVKYICDEKGISYESVLETIEAALAAAYRKDFGNKTQNIKVDFDIDTGKIKVFDVKTVVEDVPEEALVEAEAVAQTEAKKPAKPIKKDIAKIEEKAEDKSDKKESDMVGEEAEEEKKFNPKTDLQISDAKEVKKDAKVGDEIVTELEVPGEFGRMAAQTAKQVITQKLREAEREVLFDEFKDKEDEMIVGTVQRQEGRRVLVDLGRVTGVLPNDEQIPFEHYKPGDHIKVYVVSVEKTTKGPEIILSRAHTNIVKNLFASEVPEIASGSVEIKGIARDAGSRSKVSVFTEEENIDPIGSCIGQRGARVRTIITELKGEKIDIVEYSDDPAIYITNALAPAKVTEVELNEDEKSAVAKVEEDQLSLAIGRSGQNVHLASELTGWKIDIVSSSGEQITEEGVVKKEFEDVAEGGEPAKAGNLKESKSEDTPEIEANEKKSEPEKSESKSKAELQADLAEDKPKDKTDSKAEATITEIETDDTAVNEV